MSEYFTTEFTEEHRDLHGESGLARSGESFCTDQSVKRMAYKISPFGRDDRGEMGVIPLQ